MSTGLRDPLARGEQVTAISGASPSYLRCERSSDDVQLPQAIIHPEPGIWGGRDLGADRQSIAAAGDTHRRQDLRGPLQW